MAEPRALYGMCLKADTYAARETCMDLSMAMYFRSSLAMVDSVVAMVDCNAGNHHPWMVNVFSSLRPARLRSSQGMYSAGHIGACGTNALIGAGQTPERACGTLDRSPGGFLQDDSRANFGVGDSCHLVGSERNIAAV